MVAVVLPFLTEMLMQVVEELLDVVRNAAT